MAVQDGPTSIRVTWTPPSPLGDTTGYRISYTGGGGSSDSVDVDGGNISSHTLMGLTNGNTYTLTIMGTAPITSPSPITSASVEAGTVDLCKVFCKMSTTNCSAFFSTKIYFIIKYNVFLL